MKTRLVLLSTLIAIFLLSVISFSSCKKDDDDDPQSTDYVLVIENGAQNIEPGESI